MSNINDWMEEHQGQINALGHLAAINQRNKQIEQQKSLNNQQSKQAAALQKQQEELAETLRRQLSLMEQKNTKDANRLQEQIEIIKKAKPD
jgi:hypothetical protein